MRFDALLQVEKNHMRQNQVSVFDLLHVMARHDDGAIEQGFHLAPPAPCQANRACAFSARQLQRPEHVRRIAAAADAEGYVPGLDEILHLPGKNLFILRIVAPRRD